MKKGQILTGKIYVYGEISSYAKTVVWYYSGVKRTWKYFYHPAEELLAIWKLPPPGVTELMMLSHFSLTFFHPSFPSPPATAARIAIPLYPVIPVTAVAWAKDKAGSEITPLFQREQQVWRWTQPHGHSSGSEQLCARCPSPCNSSGSDFLQVAGAASSSQGVH